MKIRELINVLEQYEKESEHGKETEVKIELHLKKWNASGFFIEVPIDDIVIAHAAPCYVGVECVINKSQKINIDKLYEKMDKLYPDF